MSVRTARWILIIAILVGLLSIGVNFYLQYVAFNQQIASDAALTELQQQNSQATLSALEAAGVSAQQVSQGFWYITTDQYGNQSIAYFDLSEWSAQSGLTLAQIAALAETVASSTVVNKNQMYAVPESQLPPDLQFHNELYSGQLQPGQFSDTQATLEAAYKSGMATADQLWELSYMDELQGDYADRDAIDAADCKLFQQRCSGTLAITLTGNVVDEQGNPIEDASVSVLDDSSIKPVTTDDKGDFSITMSALPLEKIRVEVQKPDYTQGIASAITLSSGKSVYELGAIQLTTPIVSLTIDTAKHTVTDPKDTANADGSFVLTDGTSTYDIPAGAIVNPDGSPYSGPADVYIYDFTRDTVPQSLVDLDTFDDVAGYAGNLMQTLGMPYIQFFTPSGQELAVMKSDPMLLTFNIPGWEDMKDNFLDRSEGPLTDAQIQTILAASEADPDGFPITSQFLLDNKISTFAAFWVFDTKSGVWDNTGARLLNASGTIQVQFYTINNERS